MFGIVTVDGKLTYCNAGHNPPIVLGKAGVRRLEAGGPVVGLLEAAPYVQATETLDRGDIVVLFSDGVSEAFNVAGEDFGEARLLEVTRKSAESSTQQLLEQIIAAVRTFTTGAAQSDDITVMVLRYLGA
jgi:sigma-B regulation protein RsbU (phosphoserine phosphatase)